MRISILRGFGNDATVIDFSKLFHLQAASCNWERYLYYIYNNYTHICSYIHYIRLSGSLYHKLFHGVMTTSSLKSISTERVLGF